MSNTHTQRRDNDVITKRKILDMYETLHVNLFSKIFLGVWYDK